MFKEGIDFLFLDSMLYFYIFIFFCSLCFCYLIFVVWVFMVFLIFKVVEFYFCFGVMIFIDNLKGVVFRYKELIEYFYDL